MADTTDTEDHPISAWDKGKAEAAKRFGNAKPSPNTPAAGTAAGIAEARRRFGHTTKQT
ncbi:hypothetical protein [Arthrobacter sp. AL12]|uniref:hypothetical protein n=1 Tax=Arthrobacter sp. AL12 TaxID=3042241 RepID=UPI00249B06E5|nr:hypothetical protein [Arthrobacter sp. AL12]MDI3211700.1 hypothetical protein [Arthrobacter sp. AL12]